MTECRRLAAFGIAARFMRDQSGVYAALFGLMAPVCIGTLALGAETALWYSTHEKMQGAANSAAISAAVGLIAGNTNYALQANATTASNGFVNGSSGTVVTVNKPPLSGPNTGTAGARRSHHQTTPKTLVLLPFSQVTSGCPSPCAANRGCSITMAEIHLEPDSKDNYRASRLTAIWMQASVTNAARVRPRFS